ncbi:MAG: hypothetical protein P8Y67_12340 [Alphaproteobacteria bacterium]
MRLLDVFAPQFRQALYDILEKFTRHPVAMLLFALPDRMITAILLKLIPARS